MKRRDLIAHLARHGCRFLREGGRNPTTDHKEAVPRHTEIDRFLARKICRMLTVPDPE